MARTPPNSDSAHTLAPRALDLDEGIYLGKEEVGLRLACAGVMGEWSVPPYGFGDGTRPSCKSLGSHWEHILRVLVHLCGPCDSPVLVVIIQTTSLSYF